MMLPTLHRAAVFDAASILLRPGRSFCIGRPPPDESPLGLLLCRDIFALQVTRRIGNVRPQVSYRAILLHLRLLSGAARSSRPTCAVRNLVAERWLPSVNLRECLDVLGGLGRKEREVDALRSLPS